MSCTRPSGQFLSNQSLTSSGLDRHRGRFGRNPANPLRSPGKGNLLALGEATGSQDQDKDHRHAKADLLESFRQFDRHGADRDTAFKPAQNLDDAGYHKNTKHGATQAADAADD